jgi:hypothetical protein
MDYTLLDAGVASRIERGFVRGGPGKIHLLIHLPVSPSLEA